MSTPEPPTALTPPPRPRRRLPLTRTGVLLAVAALAILVVGGVVGALVFARPAAADVPRPGVAHAAPAHKPGKQAGPAADGARGPGRDALMGGPVLAGVVVSTADGSLVVTPDGGMQRTLRTDATTKVAGPGKPALTDLKAGERVVVRVTGTGDAATATVVRVVVAHVVGTVTAVSGTTGTVTSYEGLTVQVDVTGLAQKPAVGDVVELSGTASGSTLTATQVKELPKVS